MRLSMKRNSLTILAVSFILLISSGCFLSRSHHVHDETAVEEPSKQTIFIKNSLDTFQGDSAVFIVVEVIPTYVGGEQALYQFLLNNLNYPDTARDAGIEGTVYVSFVIEKDGSVSNAKVVRDIGGGCGREALRVVNLMPKWNPGQQKGKAVRCQFILPVSFTLK